MFSESNESALSINDEERLSKEFEDRLTDTEFSDSVNEKHDAAENNGNSNADDHAGESNSFEDRFHGC